MLMVFVTTSVAQNPFVTKADIIEDFNLSPNEEMIVYREFPAEGLPNISIKNIQEGEITTITHTDLKNPSASELFSGADFLSDGVVVLCKDNYMVSFDMNENKSKQLFKLPDNIIILRFIKASNDGKGIYFAGGDKVYYASMKDGIVAETDKCKFDETIMSLTVDKHNRAFYTTTARKVYCFDELNKEKDVTSEISKLVAAPYLIEAGHEENSFIVAGKDAVFKIDLSTGKSVKLMDNNPENRLYIMRLSPDGKALYYNTLYEKRKIRKLEFADNQANDSGAQDNVVLDINNK